uniref:Uncharacterized protein n=1 Tax=Rhizophora mucronata TaxID=61149 RepID=A0A2P2MQK1_RHIMU
MSDTFFLKTVSTRFYLYTIQYIMLYTYISPRIKKK